MELFKRTFTYYRNQLKQASFRYFSLSVIKCKEPEKNLIEKGTTEDGWPKRIVTGIQPTGSLHVGNYFGAISQCVKLQEKGEDLMIFIADLHALTTPQVCDWIENCIRLGRHDRGSISKVTAMMLRFVQFVSSRWPIGRDEVKDPSQIQEKTLEVAAYLLASGIDPERSVLFVQSAVPRHTELCWVLTCLATHARLAHLPQYKEKSATMKEVPMGLLLYPVLQAADVLAYRGTHVPVGADQLQHLQVASQLVRTFHHRYGRFFPTPRAVLPDESCDRIRSLRDPSKKMSKSDTDPKSRILLSDTDDAIALKLRKAVTDFTPEVSYCPATRPGVSNLVALHCLADELVAEEAVMQAEGLTTAQYKREVAAALVRRLRPVRDRAQALLRRPEVLRDVLRAGAVRARRRADRVRDELARRLCLAPHKPAPLATPSAPHDMRHARAA